MSLPLVVSTISTTVMIFIDRMFLLWYAPKAMAAAMPAQWFRVLDQACDPRSHAADSVDFAIRQHCPPAGELQTIHEAGRIVIIESTEKALWIAALESLAPAASSSLQPRYPPQPAC